MATSPHKKYMAEINSMDSIGLCGRVMADYAIAANLLSYEAHEKKQNKGSIIIFDDCFVVTSAFDEREPFTAILIGEPTRIHKRLLDEQLESYYLPKNNKVGEAIKS